MKHIRLQRLGSTLAILSLALVFVASGPVSAQHGADDDTSSSTSSAETEHANSTETNHNTINRGVPVKAAKTAAQQEAEGSSEHNPSDDGPNHLELHKKGDDMVARLRKEHAADKTKTAAQHQKICEAHKKSLQTKFTGITGNSNRAQTRISSILDKAVAYQQANNIQATDFDNLVAVAQTAKTTSAASITALKAVSPTIDCTSTTVPNDVATFRAATDTARTNLKAYRSTVKAVLKSLEAAKPAKTTEGSN